MIFDKIFTFKMKLALLALLMVMPSYGSELVTIEEIENLISRYVRKTLQPEEEAKLNQVVELLRVPNFMSRSNLAELGQPRTTITCIVCRSAFTALIDGVREGQTDEELVPVFSSLCFLLGIESQKVCNGVIALNLPIVTYIIRNNPDANSNAFCGLVFQTIDEETCPFTDIRFEWEIDLPPAANSVRDLSRNDDTQLKIALLTDAHLDPLYEAYGVGNCGEPTCCRVGQTADSTYRYDIKFNDSLIGESIQRTERGLALDLEYAEKLRQFRRRTVTRKKPTRNVEPAGYWGDYRSCDTPIWAYDDLVDRIAEAHEGIDMIYYIGDSIDHGVWETNYELINNMNRYVIDKLQEKFPDVPILPAIGNHESQPTNQFAPTYITQAGLDTNWLYNALADKWSPWLPADAQETLRMGGYYTVLVKPGFRVIALNTNIAYKYNWWLVFDPLEAKKHLEFLVEELYKAEQNGERVHILSHIPPGTHDLSKTWTREYSRIVNRFSNTIAAEFNGHVHSDEIKLFYNDAGAPINVAWGIGSATAYTYYNLNYKIMYADSTTYTLIDIENYVYNLTEANLTPNARPHWFMLYDFRNTFQVPELTASHLDNFVRRMVTTDRTLLRKYVEFFHKLSDARSSYGCDEDCILHRICLIVVTELWEREKCNEIRQLYYNFSAGTV